MLRAKDFEAGFGPSSETVIPHLRPCWKKTQDGVPSCVDARYAGKNRTVKPYHLLLFDGAGNVVDYEDQEARFALISVGLIVPRKEDPYFSRW